MTERRRSDEYGMRVAGRGCVKGVGGEHKKQMADEREETGHGYGTYNDRSGGGLSASQKHVTEEARTAMHHRLEANSPHIGDSRCTAG